MQAGRRSALNFPFHLIALEINSKLFFYFAGCGFVGVSRHHRIVVVVGLRLFLIKWFLSLVECAQEHLLRSYFFSHNSVVLIETRLCVVPSSARKRK